MHATAASTMGSITCFGCSTWECLIPPVRARMTRLPPLVHSPWNSVSDARLCGTAC
jgi:hypothetical protein